MAIELAVSRCCYRDRGITQVPEDEAIQTLSGLTPVRYTLRDDPGRQRLGFVAEDAPPEIPLEQRGVSVPAIVATLTGVVKAQQQMIEKLESRLAALEAKPPPGP